MPIRLKELTGLFRSMSLWFLVKLFCQVLWHECYNCHYSCEIAPFSLYSCQFLLHVLAKCTFTIMHFKMHVCLAVWSFISLIYKIIFFFSICLFLRERQSVSKGGAEREGDTESKAGSRLWAAAQSLMWGSNSQTMRSWPEPKSDI